MKHHSISSLFLLCLFTLISLNAVVAEKLSPIGYALLDELLSKYGSDENQINPIFSDNQLVDQQNEPSFAINNARVAKSYDGILTDTDLNPSAGSQLGDIRGSGPELSFNGPTYSNDLPYLQNGIRDEEFLEHSSLWRHQMMTGGAGEGHQRLKPDGSVHNVQVVKSDSMLPAYCTPPNPCPPGYSEEDGCLPNFQNTASFSRDFQSMQDCMCDSEHMFNCDANTVNREELNGNNGDINQNGDTPSADTVAREEDGQLNAIARSLANQPMNGEMVDQIIGTLLDHKVVAKKFMIPKLAAPQYFKGERLPIVAKKSPGMS